MNFYFFEEQSWTSSIIKEQKSQILGFFGHHADKKEGIQKRNQEIQNCFGPMKSSFKTLFDPEEVTVSKVDEENQVTRLKSSIFLVKCCLILQKLTAKIKGKLLWTDERVTVPTECSGHENAIRILPEALIHVFNGSEVEQVLDIKKWKEEDPELHRITMNRVSQDRNFV